MAAAGAAISLPLAAGDRNGLRFAVEPGTEIAARASEWATLADDALADNAFFGPGFAIPAIGHLGGGHVAIASVRAASGALAALAPFTRVRLGHIAPAVRLWSHKYAPFGAPLVGSDRPEAALACLVEGLAPTGSGLSLILPDMPAAGSLATELRLIGEHTGRPLATLDEHHRAALVRDPAAGETLRNRLPIRRRKELGRQMRRLAELGPVEVESAVEADAVRARFEEFLALEQAGWKGRRGTALASMPASAAFARDMVSNLAARGAARIVSLRTGGRPVATLVALVGRTTAFAWKIAYDETCARFSPGAQLMLEAPARIFAGSAVTRIDSCAAADHDMANRLWPDRLALATFVLGPSGGGAAYRVGLAAARAEMAARMNARHLRDRFA